MSNLSPAAVLYDSSGNEKGVVANPVYVDGALTTSPAYGSSDSFGAAVIASRYNQVEIDFSSTDPDLITAITVTKSNGGDATNTGGQAVFTTSTATNGGIKAVTNLTVEYRPHAEVYAAFTCIFTTGVANSYQRIGIYDDNNGFFVGYEGTSFGVTLRKAGVDVTIPRASFNVDTLTGGASSRFTRNGTPETLDPTKDNLYRIRFGWLGAAPVYFDVLSPDGEWVLAHIYRHPNTVAATSINDPNLPMTLDAQKTAGATNITMRTACWAAGSTSDLGPLDSAITDDALAKLVRAVLAAKKPNNEYTNIQATAGGNLKVSVEEVETGVRFASILYDGLGNQVAVTPDGGVYKLEVLATIGGSASGVGATVTARNNTNALAVESRPLESLLLQILQELQVMRRQMATITGEDDPL